FYHPIHRSGINHVSIYCSCPAEHGHSCMKEEQHLDKIAKYLSENSDSKEREDLFAWIKEDEGNKKILEESMEVWEMASAKDLESQPDTEEAWHKMNNRLNEARGQQSGIIRSLPFTRSWLRNAAAVLVLIGVSLWSYSRLTTSGELIETRTIAEQKTTIELPDGSKVWLNQNSTLSYEKQFGKRVVFLEGEAFFDVAKKNGQSFEIYAGESKTRVLGTSFNVRAYPKENKVEIAVESGKVQFSAKDMPTEKALLTKGEAAVYTKSSQVVEKLEISKLNASAWQKGALRFNESALVEVIESLERYYDINIEVSNPKIYNCVWNNTATYQQPALEELLSLIEYTNSL
ncbi:MAG: FecR domain-containing protein, partial [Bacteroidota bacterium]